MIELAGIIILGILAQWVAWRLKIPAILPLILIGLFVGPISTLISEDGTQWIQPIWNGREGFFPGESLYYFVSLAIGIILFEGGLTLKFGEVNKVGSVIGKLISVGSFVTFVGCGIAAYFILGLDWKMSFLFSSLIIVTGPTVITPILRNIPLRKEVSAVLKWEGILIDPIGALVAVLVFEFISVKGDLGYTKQAFVEFGKIILIGFSFGISGGYALYFAIKKKLIPHYLLNVVSLSVVLLIFVESDVFAHESGLLSVVVMGMFLGNRDLPNLKELLYFKESLSVLLISILFILLSANITLEDLELVANYKTAILFAIIIFVVRPIGVFLSTLGSAFKLNEKLFISWVGPRGIVAAGIASLFGSKLAAKGVAGAEYITPLVFAVVLVTVLLNAATARYFAKIVGVFLKKSEGILIIGASNFPRLLGQYLKDNGRHVVLIDSNENNIERANRMQLEAFSANIYSSNLMDNIELSDVGYLMSLTGNTDINKYAINKFGKQFGENGAFRLVSSEEMNDPNNNPEQGLFSHIDDFNSVTKVAEQYPNIQELELRDKDHYDKLIDHTDRTDMSIPLFIKDKDGDLAIISSFSKDMTQISAGDKLVYIGETLKLKESETTSD